MEEFPLLVVDAVVAKLNTFKGLIAYDKEIVHVKDRKVETTVFARSTTNSSRKELFKVVSKRTQYPADVYCAAIKSGYRSCADCRVLKSCLLSQCKSEFAKKVVGNLLDSSTVQSLIAETVK